MVLLDLRRFFETLVVLSVDDTSGSAATGGARAAALRVACYCVSIEFRCGGAHAPVSVRQCGLGRVTQAVVRCGRFLSVLTVSVPPAMVDSGCSRTLAAGLLNARSRGDTSCRSRMWIRPLISTPTHPSDTGMPPVTGFPPGFGDGAVPGFRLTPAFQQCLSDTRFLLVNRLIIPGHATGKKRKAVALPTSGRR